MGDNEKSGNIGCLQSIFNLLGNIVTEILNTIVSIVFAIIAYVLIVILIFFSISNSQSVTFLCCFGLVWIVLCMYLFVRFVKQSISFNERIRYLDSIKDKKLDTFSNYLFQIDRFFARYGGTKAFKLASLTIIFAHTFTILLIESGSGELASYFDIQKWSSGFWGFVIIPFLIGMYLDVSSRITNEVLNPSLSARSLYFLGAFEFFSNIVIYLTGIVGGKESFISVKAIDDLIPFGMLFTKWYHFSSYTETNIYGIYSHLSLFEFLFIYVLLPVLVIFSYFIYRNKDNTLIPVSIIEPAYKVSLLILIIPLYVAWQEGLIDKVCSYIGG
jgi:hypothetical protein